MVKKWDVDDVSVTTLGCWPQSQDCTKSLINYHHEECHDGKKQVSLLLLLIYVSL